jgi:flavodoxin
MKYVVAYWSRFGNNKRIALKLEELLKQKGDVSLVVAGEGVKLPDADVYVFSAAAERFSVNSEMKALMKGLSGMEGKKYAVINTHALGFHSWLGRMNKLLSKSGMAKVAELDFRVSGAVDKGEGLPAGWEGKLAEFAGKL